MTEAKQDDGILAKLSRNKEMVILVAGFLGIGGYEGFKPKENVEQVEEHVIALERDNAALHKENQILIDGYNSQEKEIQEQKENLANVWSYIDENSGKWNAGYTTSQRNASIIDKHH